MLRSDIEVIHDYRRNLEWNGTLYGGKPRGTVDFDSVHVAANYADEKLIGTILGLPIYREADLANGKFVYYSWDGSTIATNV